jgi:archaellum component FlaC
MNEFGATAQMAGQFGARYDKAVAGGATQEQLDMMMQKFLDAVNQFNEATDTAKDSTARFKDSIAEVRDEFTEKFPRKMALLQKQLAPIAEKFLHLRKQLLEGKISSEDFEKAVEKLESSMKKAADTIETKLAPAVDNAASGRSRGGGANPYAGAGPAAYGRGPGGYSGNQNGGGGFGGQGFGGQSATGGAGYINPFDYGMRAGLMAQAQMLQSAIQALSSDRRWTMGTGKKNELKDQLEDVMNRLRNLKEKPPTFSGVNNALTGDDPALTGVDSGGGSRQVSMSFPNITRMTNADASKVMDMLDQEMRRRGTRL